MKQNISTKDLELLTEEGKKRLIEWWKPRKPENQIWSNSAGGGGIIYPNLPRLSIGECIEFLDENSQLLGFHKGVKDWMVVDGNNNCFNIELIDALWNAVVEVLND